MAQEEENLFTELYFSIVSSGSGGSALGHAYLTFCPFQTIFRLENCKSLEYNLDINLGEKSEHFKKQDLLTKYEMFDEANFRVYEHVNAKVFAQKYIDRGQSIEFFVSRLTDNQVKKIYEDIINEKHERDVVDYKDYSIGNNNCVTKLFDVINNHTNVKIVKESDSTFDVDNFLFQFPVYARDRIIESHLFSSSIILGQNYWKSEKFLKIK